MFFTLIIPVEKYEFVCKALGLSVAWKEYTKDYRDYRVTFSL